MKRHLQYWRASLIDSGKKTPSDGLLNESITESWDEIKKGRSSAAKKLIPFTPEGATPRPVTVCIIAKWAAAKVSHGERNRNVERSIYPIVMFYAKLNNLGEFFVDKDCGEPFVPREFVSPNDGVSFIDMDSLDRFYQGKVEQISSWSDMIRFAEDLYRSLDVSDDCIIEDIEGKCWILADSKNSAADAVIGLYDNLIICNCIATARLNAAWC